MNIKAFQVNELGVNCYLIWDDKSREAALIDCGAQAEYEWDAINIEMNVNSFRMVLLFIV